MSPVHSVLFVVVVVLCLLKESQYPLMAQSSATRPELVLQIGHSDDINGIVFSPDGQTLVSASDDNTVKIWDVPTGMLRRTLVTGHTRGVDAIAFSPDGRTLASGDLEDTVRLWNVQTGQLRQTLKLPPRVTAIAFSPDGRSLVCGSGGSVGLWDIQTGKALWKGKRFVGAVTSIAVSPNSQTIASASEWGSKEILTLWDARTGQVERTLMSRGWWKELLLLCNYRAYHVENLVAFLPDGKMVISGDSGNGVVKLWDIQTGKLLRTLRGHGDSVLAVACSSDGRTVASASYDGTVTLWDMMSSPRWALNWGAIGQGLLLLIVTGFVGRRLTRRSRPLVEQWEIKLVLAVIVIWTVSRSLCSALYARQTVPGNSEKIRSAAFSPDLKVWASGCEEGDIELREVQTGALKRTLKGGGDESVIAFARSSNGETLVSWAKHWGEDDYSGRAWLWNTRTGRLEQKVMQQSSCSGYDVAFTSEGSAVAFAHCEGNKVTLYDVTTGKRKRTLLTSKHSPTTVTFSPDGKTIASAGSTTAKDDAIGEVRLWDVETGKLRQTVHGHSYTIDDVAFSPDSRTLVIDDDVIKLWDIQTGKVKRTLRLDGDEGSAESFAFSSDGQMLAIGGGYSGAINLWDTQRWTMKRLRQEHNGSVNSLVFSPDGKTLASGSADHTVKLWDTHTGKLRRTLTGHSGAVLCVSFSPDNKTVTSGSIDGTLKVWGADSGRLLVTLLILPSSKEGEPSTDWIVFTPEGYYDSSTRAKPFIRWRVGNELFPAERYEKTYHRPDFVQKALRGER